MEVLLLCGQERHTKRAFVSFPVFLPRLSLCLCYLLRSSLLLSNMALVNPFLCTTRTSLPLRVSGPPNQVLPRWTLCSQYSFKTSSLRSKQLRCGATADIKADHAVLVGPTSEEERKGDYDWTQEWYPLYLTQNVPEDAPLGLRVFDKQLVLFKDGNGQFRCYEDRCPHRSLPAYDSVCFLFSSLVTPAICRQLLMCL